MAFVYLHRLARMSPLLGCKLSEMSSSDKDASASPCLSEFEDELTKAIQIITAHFLSRRRNLSSDTIVDVASPAQVTTLRDLAIPQSNPQPLQSAIKRATQIFAHRMRNEHPRFFGFIPSPVSPVAWIAQSQQPLTCMLDPGSNLPAPAQ